jgi:tartrate dehydrogenase/decarboxylase / D-malate dehydrogenase
MSSRHYRIASIPGDGIGREVIPAGIAALETASARRGFALEFTELPYGCAYYSEFGRMMEADGLERLAAFDAIYLGAVGDPSVPDHITLRELLLPIRQRFDQYVNLRPMGLLPGLVSPLAGRGPAEIDMVCVRENVEGEYVGAGGHLYRGRPEEVATQAGIFTRRGIERVVRYAFELASRRPRRQLASATKSNALQYSMVLWDEVAEQIARQYPSVSFARYHVDALAARMVTNPASLDVIVASNLFGDILTDLGAALCGSIGLAASGNLNPERRFPSMFEPIHGSAPDIAGRGVANPIGAISAGALLLDHLGEREASRSLDAAVSRAVADGVRTADLGGVATTREMTDAICRAI